ncbi:hypothetical protein ACFXMP_45640, partial [Streptomyces anulatus]
KMTWTADSRRLVLWDRRNGPRRSYAAEDLNARPVALEHALSDIDTIQGVVGIGGSEIALLSQGRLAAIDASDGRVTTRPFSVYQGSHADETSEGSFVGDQLVARPKHPGQVIVNDRHGEILLWDLRAPRRLSALPGARVSYGSASAPFPALLAFDPTGTYLAVVNDDAQARVWNIPDRKQFKHSIPWADDRDGLVGLTPDGHVMIFRDGQLRFVNPDRKESDFTVPVMKGFFHIDGDRLIVDTGAARQSFDLRPKAQFQALCDAAGRDYTGAESRLLPEGTPDEPPCS